jgi:hypothetical protein
MVPQSQTFFEGTKSTHRHIGWEFAPIIYDLGPGLKVKASASLSSGII